MHVHGLYILDWLCVIHQTIEYDHTITFFQNQFDFNKTALCIILLCEESRNYMKVEVQIPLNKENYPRN